VVDGLNLGVRVGRSIGHVQRAQRGCRASRRESA
jgi:hypothetical protein